MILSVGYNEKITKEAECQADKRMVPNCPLPNVNFESKRNVRDFAKKACITTIVDINFIPRLHFAYRLGTESGMIKTRSTALKTPGARNASL